MLSKLKRCVVLAPAALLPLITGCETPPDEHSPLLHTPLNKEALHTFYEPSIQHAVAYNMAMSDGHFQPHTVKLNGLGMHHLDRIGANLEQYGGTVRYETRITDEDLVTARLATVQNYLIDTGLDMTDVKIVKGLSGGRGILSVDALEAREKLKRATTAEAATGVQKEVSEN
jgi:hypothetical protein